MPSQHLNLKLNEDYMDMIKDIAKTLGITNLSKVFGSIPLVLRFSITYTNQELHKLYSSIPPLHPKDLDVLLTSIKNVKIKEYHTKRAENKQKLPKEVIPTKIGDIHK